MNQKRVLHYLAEFRLRVGRGQGFFYDFRNAVVSGAAISVLLNLNKIQGLLASLIIYAAFFVVGSIRFFIELDKTQAVLGSTKYNPHLKKLDKIVRQTKKIGIPNK